jgi:hypothetical protein
VFPNTDAANAAQAKTLVYRAVWESGSLVAAASSTTLSLFGSLALTAYYHSALRWQLTLFRLHLARRRRAQGSETGSDRLEFGASAAPAHSLAEDHRESDELVGQARDKPGKGVVGKAVANLPGARVQPDRFDLFVADIRERVLELLRRIVNVGAADEVVEV